MVSSNGMLRNWVICGCALIATLLPQWSDAQSKAREQNSAETYTMRLPVDEVVLTFNAVDSNGLPVNDLKDAEIRLWDNGAAPRRIVAFDQLVNRPLRAGILLDTSESARSALAGDKEIAKKFVERLFRQKS